MVSFEIRPGILIIRSFLDEPRKYWLFLGEVKCDIIINATEDTQWWELASTVRNHYGKFSEKSTKCLQSLYLWVHAILKAPCLSFFKFFTTSFKHLCFSKLQNQKSKNRLMEATRLILTIWCGWLCMSTSILWPAWSAPLRIWAPLRKFEYQRDLAGR